MAISAESGKQVKWARLAVPVGCAKSPFGPLFVPFGTTSWTIPGVNVQSTQGESFI